MTTKLTCRSAVVAAGLVALPILATQSDAGIIQPMPEENLLPRVLDFDTDADGNAILHGQVIDDEYANWGVSIDVQHPQHHYLDFGVALGTDVSIEEDMRTGVAYGAYHASNDMFLGNVLITPRNDYDFNHDDILDTPDTAYERPNGVFKFSFTDMNYTATTLTILDAEEAGGTIEAYYNGSNVGNVNIPALGDNAVVTLELPDGPIDHLIVRLAGSGGLNDLTLMPVPEPTTAALLAGATLLGLRRRK